METAILFGIPIAVGEREELLSAAVSVARHGGRIVTPNLSILSHALHDRALYHALVTADLALPDGVSIVRLLARRGYRASTLPGVELGELLLDRTPHTLALIGGVPGVASEAMDALRMRHPTCRPAFTLSGYGIRRAKCAELIRRTSPDLVYLGIGSPRQELFARRLAARFPRVTFVSLGGSLDVYAGRVRRAPKLFRRARLEWLWRVLREPRRLPPLISSLFLLLRKEKQNNLIKFRQSP